MNNCKAYNDGRDGHCWAKNGENVNQKCDNSPRKCPLAPRMLHLTLTKKWFGMILSGEKKEEYREQKIFWYSRLCKMVVPLNCEIGNHEVCTHAPEDKFIHFDFIEFRNGYSKDAPTMTVECKGVTTGTGRPEWGAPSHPVFIIKLGDILETKNLKK